MATTQMSRRGVKHPEPKPSAKPSGSEPCYVRNPWLTSQAALEQVNRVMDFIVGSGKQDTVPDETALFCALHACAYQYHRTEAASDEMSRWLNRWTAIREHIIQANLGLLYSMMVRFNSPQVDSDDLSSFKPCTDFTAQRKGSTPSRGTDSAPMPATASHGPA
jgi:hypothetical protein